MRAANFARGIAMAGYFGLWPLISLWYTVLAPTKYFGIAIPLVFLLVPLLFPLAGMIKGKQYTYAWTSFLSMYYFAHGIGEAWSDPVANWYGMIEVVLSLMWFVGAIVYVRLYKARAQQTPASGEAGE